MSLFFILYEMKKKLKEEMTKLTHLQIPSKEKLTKGKMIHSNHKNVSHFIKCYSSQSFNLLLPIEFALQDLYTDRWCCENSGK